MLVTGELITGGLWDAVGRTPLIRIRSLSEETGCEIFGKAEFLNPTGSVKDRAAKGILRDAENSGQLKAGDTLIDGTAGNTGIALAVLGRERGYNVVLTMPNNQAREKFEFLKALEIEVIAVPPCPFANPDHFYHTAGRVAQERGYFWANQFENISNSQIHFDETGPEIFQQMNGKIDIAVMASGSGGTIGGVTSFLKTKLPNIRTVLADPFGSGLFSYLKTGEMKTEGSSVIEGIGIMRLTANFKRAQIDDAIKISDEKMMTMFHRLAKEDGLVVGPSAALNVQAAYELALQNKGRGLRIVTILCDPGTRYSSRLFTGK